MTKPTSDAYGRWEVTTEGDCEGRTTKHLGTHEGYLDDIAFALGEQGGYSLSFKRVPPLGGPVCMKINVSLDIGTKTWDMNPTVRANYVATMLRDRDVTVEESNYYAAAMLIRGKSPEERARIEREMVREWALSKLTAEEARALAIHVDTMVGLVAALACIEAEYHHAAAMYAELKAEFDRQLATAIDYWKQRIRSEMVTVKP